MCRHLEITESTRNRWRAHFSGMKADDAKRLKELEKGNTRLKKIVADQTLDSDAGKLLPGHAGDRTLRVQHCVGGAGVGGPSCEGHTVCAVPRKLVGHTAPAATACTFITGNF